MWERILLTLVSLVLAFGSLGVALWALITGQVRIQGLDGLFLIMISLAAALAFSLYSFREIRRGLLRDVLSLARSRLSSARKREETERHSQRMAETLE